MNTLPSFMLWFLIVTLAVTPTASGTAAGADKHNFTGHSVALKGKQAIALSKQCSRPSPEGILGSWNPSTQQIRQMEQNLVQYLREHYPAMYQQLDQVYFQYAGLIRKQGRFIYINALDAYAGSNPDWRRLALIVCDGGAQFWGLEYDPVTEKFSAMYFNLGLP